MKQTNLTFLDYRSSNNDGQLRNTTNCILFKTHENMDEFEAK